MKTNLSQIAWTLMVGAGLALGGCSQGGPKSASAPRVENHELGIAIAALPAPFAVTVNEGPMLELQAPGDSGPADLYIETTAEIAGGINLVAEAEGMQTWFEDQEGGQYFGNLELGTPLGPAFTSRGAYMLDGVEVEEIRLFAIHPESNRMLRMTYRYPPGEGKERLQQMAEVLGEVEGLSGSGQDANSAESDS